METIVVEATDKFGESCLMDSMDVKPPIAGRKPEGYVEIYELDKDGNKKLLGKHNLVLYVGREWVASRIVNVENTNITPDEDEFISWLGLGTGGAPVGDPLNPNTPLNTDNGLSTEIGISSSDANCADLRTGLYYKHPFDSVEFQQDPSNNNQWLIIKITTTIGTDDANGNNLNEAGLFTSASSAGAYGGPFNIFSLVTFPTIVKDNTRQIMFMWYLYV